MNIIKICYSIEPRDRRYVKGYGFLSFAKNIGKTISNKYSQELVDSAKKFASDAIKTASEKPIQKTAEATGDSIAKTNADKITSASKKCSKELSLNEANNEISKERYIYISQERQQIMDELLMI